MMSLNRYLSVNGRQNSLSSIYSNSMESLSSSYGAADSYWSIDQELTQTSTAYTIPRLRTKTSDYDTGFSATEFDEEKKHIHSRKSGRIRKVLKELTFSAEHCKVLIRTNLANRVTMFWSN